MKTKTIFKSALVVLLLGASVSAMAEYVKDPTLCNGMTATWNATARTFTVKNLKPNIQEPYCAWVTDPMMTPGTYDDALTSWGGITPGATTYVTTRLNTKWGDPSKGGTNGSSYLFVAIKSVNNDLPKGANSEDCNVTFPSDFEWFPCMGKTPTYCENYNASFNGSIINASGLTNCVPDNQYMVADAGFTKWQSVPFTLSADGSTGTADVKALTYYQSTEMVYPYGDGVMFYMTSDDKGFGISVKGPNYCSKTFTPPIQNSTSDITTISITISPNPATPCETITIKGEYDSDAKVSITSVGGAMVGSVTPSVGTDAMTVSLSGLNLQAGIYFIRIESGEKVFSGKLCVK
jgi:Secretion system C-terminal sorting domain